MDITTIENWLWEAACKIRGEVDAPKYKDYILPLIFIKRLSDVFEDEVEKLSLDYGNRDIVEELLKHDHTLVRFYIPEKARWANIAPGVIIVVNKNKSQIEGRKSKILLINISDLYEKGRSKNYLPHSTIQKVYEIYTNWKEEEGISKIITIEEAIRNDYNLSPSRYVAKNNQEDVLPLEEAIVELEEAEEERREADKRLWEIIKSFRGGSL